MSLQLACLQLEQVLRANFCARRIARLAREKRYYLSATAAVAHTREIRDCAPINALARG